MSTDIPGILKTIPAWLVLLMVLPAVAEETPDKTSERYHSLRGTVYKKTLTSLEEDGYRTRFKIKLSAAVYKYDTIGQVFDSDLLHLQSYGLRPGISFRVPTRWENIDFIPSVNVAITYQNELGKTLVSGSIYAGFDYEQLFDQSLFGTTVGIKYGTRYDEDGLNLDDYVEFKVSARFRKNLKWTIGEHITTATPFVSASYYLDELELGTVDELVTEIERRYSIGVTFSTLPRKKLWKIKIPEIKLSYSFGDNVTGFKIRF